MRPVRAFRVNSPNVIHDTIDGEVVAINLDTGTYYSLRGSAAAIWSALQCHPVPEAVVTELAALYAAEPAILETAVARLLSELGDEGLLVASDDEPPFQASPAPAGATPPADHAPFDEPVLEKFEDMQDLILLDPIFQVDDAGWPHARQEPA